MADSHLPADARGAAPRDASRVPLARALVRRRADRRAHRARIAAQLQYFRAVVDRYAPETSEYDVPDAAAKAQAQAARTATPGAYEWKRRKAEAQGRPAPPAHGAHLDAMEHQESANFEILRALRHQFRRTAEHVAFHVRAAPWLPEDARRAARGLQTDGGAARAAAESAGTAATVGAVFVLVGGAPVAGAAGAAKAAATQALTDGLKAGGKEVVKGPLRAAGAIFRPGAHAAAALDRTPDILDALIIHADGPIARAWAGGERTDLAILRLMRHALAEVEGIVDAWAGAEGPQFVNAETFGPLPVFALDRSHRWPSVDRLTQGTVGFQLAYAGVPYAGVPYADVPYAARSFHGNQNGGRDWARYFEAMGILLYDPAAESAVLQQLDSLRVGEPDGVIRPLLEHPDPQVRRRARERIGLRRVPHADSQRR